MPVATLDHSLHQLLQAVAPPAQRRLMRQLAQGLRQRNQARQRKQQGPDGKPWAPRRKAGPVARQKKMMQGLTKRKHFTIQQQAAGIALGYTGRDARIAAVHHYGQTDRPGPNSREVKYSERRLLGISPADKAWIRQQLISAISTA